MYTRTEHILKVMLVLTWLAYIGVIIKTGAILISYGVSYFNPQASLNLYMGLNLNPLRELNFWYYTCTVSFIVATLAMKAFVLSLVIKVLSKVNLMNPFKIEVANTLEKISQVLLGIWVVAFLNNSYMGWLLKSTGIEQEQLATEEFIFVAGLVFIISQIFKRGVEIQSENELTV